MTDSSSREAHAGAQGDAKVLHYANAHPFELGKPLGYSLRGARRLRVGDYRVIYRIEPPDVVLVVKIVEPSSHSTAATSERLGRPWDCRHQKSS